MHYHKAQAPITERAKSGWRLWIWNSWIAVDQLFNAVLMAGDPDETVSSRAGKALRLNKRWARVLCWGLDKIDPGHCEASVDPTEGKDQVWREK